MSVRIRAEPAVRPLAMEALFAAGATGVQEDGDTLLTHFPPGTDSAELRRAVTAATPNVTFEIGVTPDVDWSEAWKQGIRAHQLGALTVAPPWLASEYPPARSVVIEPAAGFGTGEHPSTRSVVRLMQRVIRPGDVVADLGSGSGVLSIAAAKLGAGRVIAIEMDEDSNENAALNISLNDVAAVVTLLPGDAELLLPLVAPVDVVLANIISSVLLGLLPQIHASLTQDAGRRTQAVAVDPRRAAHDRHAVLAGLLLTERDTMLAHLSAADFKVEAEDTEGDWWAVLISPS